jgi:hypothetical protein
MTARAEVAKGNGMEPRDLPKFERHIHPETGYGEHRSWADCANSWCTWAASNR